MYSMPGRLKQTLICSTWRAQGFDIRDLVELPHHPLLESLFLVTAGAEASWIPENAQPGIFTFANGRKPVINAAKKAAASKLLADIFLEQPGDLLVDIFCSASVKVLTLLLTCMIFV